MLTLLKSDSHEQLFSFFILSEVSIKGVGMPVLRPIVKTSVSLWKG